MKACFRGDLIFFIDSIITYILILSIIAIKAKIINQKREISLIKYSLDHFFIIYKSMEFKFEDDGF
jgi:hypothetical protein